MLSKPDFVPQQTGIGVRQPVPNLLITLPRFVSGQQEGPGTYVKVPSQFFSEETFHCSSNMEVVTDAPASFVHTVLISQTTGALSQSAETFPS